VLNPDGATSSYLLYHIPLISQKYVHLDKLYAAFALKHGSFPWDHVAVQEDAIVRVFLRRFRDPNRVPRISNRVPKVRENYHRVPKIRENRVPTDPNQVHNIFLKKNML